MIMTKLLQKSILDKILNKANLSKQRTTGRINRCENQTKIR